MVIRTLIFLLLNFVALGIGGIFTGKGVPSEWYQNLLKAPWTPPGWVFGAAWTLVMICFAPFMAKLSLSYKQGLNGVLFLYGLQWILNVAWNPIFFQLQYTALGLITISSLLLLVLYFLLGYRTELKGWSLLALPYALWLFIATSLNAYIVLKN